MVRVVESDQGVVELLLQFFVLVLLEERQILPSILFGFKQFGTLSFIFTDELENLEVVLLRF